MAIRDTRKKVSLTADQEKAVAQDLTTDMEVKAIAAKHGLKESRVRLINRNWSLDKGSLVKTGNATK